MELQIFNEHTEWCFKQKIVIFVSKTFKKIRTRLGQGTWYRRERFLVGHLMEIMFNFT
jgi:hypothetical protein